MSKNSTVSFFDRAGNQAADALSVFGACQSDACTGGAAPRRFAVTLGVQNMMVDMLMARRAAETVNECYDDQDSSDTSDVGEVEFVSSSDISDAGTTSCTDAALSDTSSEAG